MKDRIKFMLSCYCVSTLIMLAVVTFNFGLIVLQEQVELGMATIFLGGFCLVAAAIIYTVTIHKEL